MKNINIKSLIIGILLTAPIILGVASGCGQDEHDPNHDHNDDGGKTNSPADGGDY